jgi:hypothetical protein
VKSGNDTGTYVLLGILILAVYLVYRSVQNVGSYISGIGSSVSGYTSGVASTAGSELSSLLALPSASLNTLGNIGSSLGINGNNILSGVTGNSVLTGISSSTNALYDSLFGGGSSTSTGIPGTSDIGDPFSTPTTVGNVINQSDLFDPNQFLLTTPSLSSNPFAGAAASGYSDYSSGYVNGDSSSDDAAFPMDNPGGLSNGDGGLPSD